MGNEVSKKQGLEDPAEDFYRNMIAVSGRRGDPELNHVYTNNITDAIHWLADMAGV